MHRLGGDVARHVSTCYVKDSHGVAIISGAFDCVELHFKLSHVWVMCKSPAGTTLFVAAYSYYPVVIFFCKASKIHLNPVMDFTLSLSANRDFTDETGQSSTSCIELKVLFLKPPFSLIYRHIRSAGFTSGE
jgi:hypothetical protein